MRNILIYYTNILCEYEKVLHPPFLSHVFATSHSDSSSDTHPLYSPDSSVILFHISIIVALHLHRSKFVNQNTLFFNSMSRNNPASSFIEPRACHLALWREFV